MRKKEEDKKKKEEEKKKKEEEKKAAGGGSKAKPEEVEMDPAQYTESRKKWLQTTREAGNNPYPHKFARSLRIDQYCERYNG